MAQIESSLGDGDSLGAPPVGSTGDSAEQSVRPANSDDENARKDFFSFLQMCTGFTLLFTAFQTGSQVSELVFSSYDKQHGTSINAYYGAVVLYVVFAMANWISPSIISLLGSKLALIAGASCFVLYLSMFLYPSNVVLYIYSTVIGFGAATLWTAQGNLMVCYSRKNTMDRNANIAWGFQQTAMLIGPLYVFFSWHGKEEISDSDRTTLFTILTAIAGSSLILFAFLRKPMLSRNEPFNLSQTLEAFKNALRIAATRQMGLLMVTQAYTGFLMSFYVLAFPTSVGSTTALPDPKSLVGIAGLMVGTGEVSGAIGWGLVNKWAKVWGRGIVIISSTFCHITAFVLLYLSIPEDAPFGENTSAPTFIAPTETLVSITGILIGIGDSGFNTQIMGILGQLYPDDSAPAFALYKFSQSFTAAVGFFYSSVLTLPWQILIQASSLLLGSASYLLVEYKLVDADTTYERI